MTTENDGSFLFVYLAPRSYPYERKRVEWERKSMRSEDRQKRRSPLCWCLLREESACVWQSTAKLPPKRDSSLRAAKMHCSNRRRRRRMGQGKCPKVEDATGPHQAPNLVISTRRLT